MHFDPSMVANFQPLDDRILVKRTEEQKIGKIIIPEAYRTPDRLVLVLAVGPKVKEVQKGDVVLLPGVALTHPDLEDGDYALVTERDVAGIYYGSKPARS